MSGKSTAPLELTMPNEKDFVIVYIMGRGHSGSTVLDLMLGNHEGIQSAAEITSGFQMRPSLCACQEDIDECEYWGRIRRKLQEKRPDCSLVEYGEMLNYMDRFYRIPQIKLGWPLPARIKRHFRSMSYDLFSLIAEESGRSYVMDSSKELGRAYYLKKSFSGQVKIIHLVRDGRAVMWSRLWRMREGLDLFFMRRKYHPKRIWPIMILEVVSWAFVNLLAVIVSLGDPNVLLVRYEDLVGDSTRELTRIGEFLGLDLLPLAKRVENGDEFKIQHAIGGNYMSHNESRRFVLKPDYVWCEKLPRVYKWMFLVLGFPINLWLGYLGRTPSGRAAPAPS